MNDNYFRYLEDYDYFTYDELLLVIKCFGDNIDNYNKICYCRYSYDIFQLAEIDNVDLEIY